MKTIWNNLNSSNNYTSSLETVLTEIMLASKYVDVSPKGRAPPRSERNFHVGRMGVPQEGLPWATKGISWEGECVFLGEWLSRGVLRTS